ncbi:MAG: hypothetical protein II962_08730 [Spirochaetales bacterium]|nr:hypothetical protein [Spirochaetales bacterium]
MESKRKRLLEIVFVAMALIMVLVSCQSAAKPAQTERTNRPYKPSNLYRRLRAEA